MMIPGFPTLVTMPQGGFPSVSMTAESFFDGSYVGYVRPGGFYSGQSGESGGTLSATLLPGYVTDAIVQSEGDFFVYFIGDATPDLVGVTALNVDGTPEPIKGPASYTAGYNLTGVSFDPTLAFVASTTYSLQLV